MTAHPKPWWERWPDRFNLELEELRSADIEFEVDQPWFNAGVLRIQITGVAGRPETLTATFPHNYPYFRFEVTAAKDTLALHQNPASKALCLFGRATAEWQWETLASAILKRVPVARELGTMTSLSESAGREQDQAEPFSDYYPYPPGAAMLVSSEWCLPTHVHQGNLTVRLMQARNHFVIRGVVASVSDSTGTELAKADQRLVQAFPGPTVSGRWIRLSAPMPVFDPIEFLKRISRGQSAAQYPFQWAYGEKVRIWGAHFPEETSRRAVKQIGWIFICERQDGGLLSTIQAPKFLPTSVH